MHTSLIGFNSHLPCHSLGMCQYASAIEASARKVLFLSSEKNVCSTYDRQMTLEARKTPGRQQKGGERPVRTAVPKQTRRSMKTCQEEHVYRRRNSRGRNPPLQLSSPALFFQRRSKPRRFGALIGSALADLIRSDSQRLGAGWGRFSYPRKIHAYQVETMGDAASRTACRPIPKKVAERKSFPPKRILLYYCENSDFNQIHSSQSPQI